MTCECISITYRFSGKLLAPFKRYFGFSAQDEWFAPVKLLKLPSNADLIQVLPILNFDLKVMTMKMNVEYLFSGHVHWYWTTKVTAITFVYMCTVWKVEKYSHLSEDYSVCSQKRCCVIEFPMCTFDYKISYKGNCSYICSSLPVMLNNGWICCIH